MATQTEILRIEVDSNAARQSVIGVKTSTEA